MAVHLTGMGWLGAVTAFALERSNIDFTWHDNNSPITAWRASTGLIYPAGDAHSADALRLWQTWLSQVIPAGSVEPAGYCYAHAAPPHGGRYKSVSLPGGMKLAMSHALVADVRRVVQQARDRYAALQVDGPPPGALEIVAHGFAARRTHVVWGWSAAARLTYPQVYDREINLYYGHDAAPAFVSNPHRFAHVYAYPWPGNPGWWRIGSAMVRQKMPRERSLATVVQDWSAHAATTMPRLRLLHAADPQPGWRPAGLRPLDVDREPGRLHYPAMNHSGVRWAPLVVRTALQAVYDWESGARW